MSDSNDSLFDPEAFLQPMKCPSDFSGQKLFIQGRDRDNTAMLGWTQFPWDLYAAGYKDAADALVKALTSRQASLDSVIYPLVFLYRQGLELQLKLILPLARRLAGQPATADTHHKLMPMWSELRVLLEQIDPREADKELPAIEEFIRQMHDVDPLSFAFRYPTTKKGEVSLPDLRHVNVRHLRDVMNSVFMLLTGVHSWLGERDQHHGI